jgi:hypothetical protein
MIKDIFIDTNCAVKLNNPIAEDYKELFRWLVRRKFDGDDPVLVVSQKLLVEYSRSCGDIPKSQNFPLILDLLLKDGRRPCVKKIEIQNFKIKHFSKAIQRKLQSNFEDRDLIPVILLSQRKYALCGDNNLSKDLILFNKFNVVVSSNPSDIPYDK